MTAHQFPVWLQIFKLQLSPPLSCLSLHPKEVGGKLDYSPVFSQLKLHHLFIFLKKFIVCVSVHGVQMFVEVRGHPEGAGPLLPSRFWGLNFGPQASAIPAEWSCQLPLLEFSMDFIRE